MIEKGKKCLYYYKGKWCKVILKEFELSPFRENRNPLYRVGIKFVPPLGIEDEMGFCELMGRTYYITKSELKRDFKLYNDKERFLCMIENI
jgi:hypothetical protein